MKFIIDSEIPFINGVFEPFGNVHYMPGKDISPAIIKDATALIIRTRSLCNEQLLSKSSVKFIATTTIGYDHIDTSYCEKAGIKWVNAPGCNSKSVEQYITAALFAIAKLKGIALCGKSIGVIGVGHVGSKVARVCRLLGMKVLLNDPPRERSGDPEQFSSLGEIKQKADFITFHVPLSLHGEDATYHMADSHFFETLKQKPIVFNSSRGEIFDTKATKSAIQNKQISGAVIDCWENEPNPDPELLRLTDIATPHIAGYSKDGKAKATQMCVQQVSRFFDLGINNWQPIPLFPPAKSLIETDGIDFSDEDILAYAVKATYDIWKDYATLRANPHLFENQRNNYPVRREFTAYSINTKHLNSKTVETLLALGFNACV
jgi:erythronate-4-phosphate dehydrogenase